MVKNYVHIILFFFCITLHAQEPIRFTTKQGLPSNHVYDIQEDADGFMWFATNRGLVKFDGEVFKTFTIKEGLPNNDTWLLDLDYEGKLWYFSKSNYQGYIKNDSIYKFPIEDNIVITPQRISKSKDNLWFSAFKIYSLKDSMFLGTSFYSKYTIKQVNEKNTSLTKKYNINPLKNPLIVNPVSNEIVFVQKDRLLFFDLDFRLKAEKKIELPDNIDYSSIETIGLTYNQISFIGFNKGFLFVDFKSKKSKYVDFTKISNVKKTDFIKIKGLKNEIQVSIFNQLFIYNYDLELIDQYEFTEQKSNIGSYKDSKGNIWLRSMTNGISLKPSTQIQSNYSLKNKKVQKINKIDGDFYVGINNDGFYKLNKKTNQYEVFKRFNKSNAEIYHIKNDTILKQSLFIGGGGSVRLNEKELNTKIIEMSYFLTSEKQYGFKDIIDFNGFTYFVSSSGISKTKKSKVEGELVNRKQGLVCSTIFKNQLYVAGSDGLHILKNDSLQRPIITNRLSKTSINTMLTTNNNLFVGTDGRGVYIYDEKKIVHLKNTDGYTIQKIVSKEDKLWLATNKGVHELTLNKNDFENSKISNSFYDSDGLLQNNTNDIYIENNTLTAASDIGIASLDVTNKIYKQGPKLYLKTKNDTLSYVNGARDNITINHYLDQDLAEPTRGTRDISINPSVDYQVNKRLNLRLFFDYRKTVPKTSAAYPITNTAGGVTVRFSLN